MFSETENRRPVALRSARRLEDERRKMLTEPVSPATRLSSLLPRLTRYRGNVTEPRRHAPGPTPLLQGEHTSTVVNNAKHVLFLKIFLKSVIIS